MTTSARPADASLELAERMAHLDLDALPLDMVHATKRYIMDCLGAAIAGLQVPGSAEAIRLVRDWGGAPEATVWGTTSRVPAHQAAFANSLLARAFDFDDVYGRTYAHLTCSVLPAALAMAEATGRRDGRTLIGAVAVGRDLICRLGLSTGEVSTAGGRANMYQFNAFAAAAVAALYLRLPPQEIVSALGLVYGQALSAKQGLADGTQVPRVHQGFAAQLGVQCARLAAAGLVGARGVFEGRFGYFPLYEDGRFDRDVLLEDYGRVFHGLDSGIKKFPVCMQSHTAIEATLEAMAGLGHPPASAISRIRVGLSHEAFHMVYEPVGERRRPSGAAQVQFSLPWVVALAAVHGSLPLTHLDPEPERDREVAEVARVVEAEIDPAVDAASAGRFSPAAVEVDLHDGRRARTYVDVPPGSPGRALDWAQVEEKFRACWAWGIAQRLPAEALERQVAQLRELERIADVGTVAGGLAAAPEAVSLR